MMNDRLSAKLLTIWLILLPLLPQNAWISAVTSTDVELSPLWLIKMPLILAIGVVLYRMGREYPGQVARVRYFWVVWVISLLCGSVALWGQTNNVLWTAYPWFFDSIFVHAAFIILAILMYRAAVKPAV